MSTPSPLLRKLQFLAAALGVAILVLFVLWVRSAPPVLPVADASAPEPAPRVPTGPAGGGIAAGAVEEPPPPPAIEQPTTSAPDLPAVLYGTVTAADGAPIQDGVFWLYRGDDHVGTDTLSSGIYTFAGLAAGPHRLRSRITGELPFAREVEVLAGATRLDIVLPARWKLTVDLVTPAGEPLLPAIAKGPPMLAHRGITAAAFAEPLAGDLPLSEHAEVDAGIGTFRGGSDLFRRRGEQALPAQTLGILTLPPDAPVHVALLMRAHVVAWQLAQPGQQSVTFTLSTDEFLGHTGTVRLRLVDANGAPVTGARVALNDAQTGGGGEQVDAEGRVTLRHLQPGRLGLEIGHKELCAPRVQVDVGPGADLDLGELVLRPGVPVEFALGDFAGRVSVRLFWLEVPPPGTVRKESWISNDSIKTYRMNVYPGRYALVATAEDGVEVREVDLHHAPAEPIRFALRPGAPLRLENHVGAGLARLDLRNAAGLPIRQREFSGTGSDVIRLPPGRYTATITDQDGTVTTRTIELVAAGATLTVP
jgi:hypothetical protein